MDAGAATSQAVTATNMSRAATASRGNIERLQYVDTCDAVNEEEKDRQEQHVAGQKSCHRCLEVDLHGSGEEDHSQDGVGYVQLEDQAGMTEREDGECTDAVYRALQAKEHQDLNGDDTAHPLRAEDERYRDGSDRGKPQECREASNRCHAYARVEECIDLHRLALHPSDRWHRHRRKRTQKRLTQKVQRPAGEGVHTYRIRVRGSCQLTFGISH